MNASTKPATEEPKKDVKVDILPPPDENTSESGVVSPDVNYDDEDCFVPYHLEWDQEPQSTKMSTKESKVIQAHISEANGVTQDQEWQEDYEDTVTDKTFHYFTKVLSRSPQQIIRYNPHFGDHKHVEKLKNQNQFSFDTSFANRSANNNYDDDKKDRQYQPLWIQNQEKFSSIKIPPCEHCKSPRMFELQIMPTMLSHLKAVYSPDNLRVNEFGTIVCFSCSNMCSTATDKENEENSVLKYVDEYIIIQDAV
eukprot:TRINITY_DN1928_c5_g1_i1.p1 TRINITY_DN1928_c5_g1~~TRINITY_DN1928_c5_g1_i1.p1  ORF type:complete len:253 (-),score=64.75 TRINITY_DN1928_c5_g1_i1:50-808(-)